MTGTVVIPSFSRPCRSAVPNRWAADRWAAVPAAAATRPSEMSARYSVVAVPPTVAGPTVVTGPPYWARRARIWVGSPSAPDAREPAPGSAAEIGASIQVFPDWRSARAGTLA